MDDHIIPECYIDTKLIKSIAPHLPKSNYNHQKGCSTVVKVMQENFDDNFAVGIVDRDKRELEYAKKFKLIHEVDESLKLYRYKNHYLIFIIPAMEKWIIARADEVGILLKSYNLPHDFRELVKITKSSTSEKEDAHSQDFGRLFKELKKRNPPSVAILSFWIKYLKDNPYDADIEFIKSETQRISS